MWSATVSPNAIKNVTTGVGPQVLLWLLPTLHRFHLVSVSRMKPKQQARELVNAVMEVVPTAVTSLANLKTLSMPFPRSQVLGTLRLKVVCRSSN